MSIMIYKAFSVRQPWAYLLCAGIKKIENRTWPLPKKYKGKWVLIHAGAKPNISIRESAVILSEDQWNYLKGLDRLLPFFQFKLATSAIIGAVKYSDCVINHTSIWAERTEVDCTHPLKCGSFKTDSCQDGCIHYYGLKRSIYNWVVSDAIIFDKPILNVKGRLSFWDFDLPGEYVELLK